jgi:toxin FitB
MLVLDTNVLSALMDPEMPLPVAQWMRANPSATRYTTAISQAEIFAGLEMMPRGRRQQTMVRAAAAMFSNDIENRVLAFDGRAAMVYGEIFAARKRAGLHADIPDLMIAAIAAANGATIVTRNVSDFAACGIHVVNPWD